MNGKSFRISLLSGKSFGVDAEGGNRIMQSLIGNGPQAIEVELEGAPVFLNTSAVAYVEVTDESDAVPAET